MESGQAVGPQPSRSQSFTLRILVLVALCMGLFSVILYGGRVVHAVTLDNANNSIAQAGATAIRTGTQGTAQVTSSISQQWPTQLLYQAFNATHPRISNSFVLSQEVTASDTTALAHFGTVVNVSNDGSTAIIGAVGRNEDKGAAYIYTKNNNGTWTEKQELTASDTITNDQFGSAVSLSNDGSIALVGANNEALNSNLGAGAAYIFIKNNGTWTEFQKLTANDAGYADAFGTTASLSDDGSTVMIGATKNSQTGAVYIFTKNNGTWSQIQEIGPAATSGHNQFGYAVSLSGDGSTALVGALFEAVNGNNGAGAAYIFTKNNNNSWEQQQEITLTDASSNDNFGYAVSLSGDGSTALISAGGKTVNSITSSGAAYIYTKSNNSWTQAQEITATDAASEDYFGNAVSLSSDGSTALVASSNKTVNGNNVAGAAYVFTKSNNSWVQTQEITATDEASTDYFGNSVSLAGNASTALIGAYNKTVNGNVGTGAVYFFSKSVATINLSSSPNPSNYGQTVTFTATLSPTDATGTVTFNFGNTSVATSVVNGTATYVTNTLPIGSNVVTATYSGDNNYAGGTTSVTQTVSSYTYYLPFVSNNANNFTTYLAFQNVGSTTASVTINYFDTNGVPITSATVITQVAQYGEVLPSNPFTSGTSGAGIITSNQPLNVIVPEATPYGGSAYAVPSGSSNSLIAPFALNNAFGDFTTQLNVFNGGASAVTATVTFYGTVGSSTIITFSTTSVTIGAHQTTNLNQNTLPNGFSGWAQVTGTANTLVAQVLEQSPSTKFVAIANAIANPSSTEYAPAIFKNGYGSFYTGANIINPNPSAVTVTVTYYDLSANATPTTPFTIPGYGVASIFNGATGGNGLPNGGLPNNFIGAVAVSAVGGPIAMSVNENGGVTAAGNSRSGTYAAISSGGSTVGLPVVSNGGYTYITGNTILNTSNQTVVGTITYYNTDGTSAGVSKSFTIAGHGSQAFYQGDGSLPSNFYGTAVITETNGPANSLVVTTNAQNIALFYTYSEPNS